MTNGEICAGLQAIENQHGVKILYAVESGSRAWGFPSPDSDWDVRFIYVHPTEWYLRVEPQRDVIEIMNEETGFDASGWELRKALRLFRRTNPSLLEWLDSRIVYMEFPGFADELKQFIPTYFNEIRAMHHYLSLAKNTQVNIYEPGTVKLKKYLYFLRSVIAAKWIAEKGTPPPVPFRELFSAMVSDNEILSAIEELLVLKSHSAEHNSDKVSSLLTDYARHTFEDMTVYLSTRPAVEPPFDKDKDLDELLFKYAKIASNL